MFYKPLIIESNQKHSESMLSHTSNMLESYKQSVKHTRRKMDFSEHSVNSAYKSRASSCATGEKMRRNDVTFEAPRMSAPDSQGIIFSHGRSKFDQMRRCRSTLNQ